MDQFEQENTQPVQCKGNFGWAVLGFFIPLVGLILFLVWKKERYGDAKMAGLGALVGVIVNVVFSIIGIVAVMSMGTGFADLLSGMGAITVL